MKKLASKPSVKEPKPIIINQTAIKAQVIEKVSKETKKKAEQKPEIIQTEEDIEKALYSTIDDKQILDFICKHPKEIDFLIKNNFSVSDLYYLSKNHQNIFNIMLYGASKAIGKNVAFNHELKSTHLVELHRQNLILAKRIIPGFDCFTLLVKNGISNNELFNLISIKPSLFCFIIDHHQEIIEYIKLGIPLRQFLELWKALLKKNFSTQELDYLSKNHQLIFNTMLVGASKIIGQNITLNDQLLPDNIVELYKQNPDLAQRNIVYLTSFKSLVKSGINCDELLNLISTNSQLFCLIIDKYQQIITSLESGVSFEQILKTWQEHINKLKKEEKFKQEFANLFDKSPDTTSPNNWKNLLLFPVISPSNSKKSSLF